MTPREARALELPWLENFQFRADVEPSPEILDAAGATLRMILAHKNSETVAAVMRRLKGERMSLAAINCVIDAGADAGVRQQGWVNYRERVVEVMARRRA